jgi:hypothetical protein
MVAREYLRDGVLPMPGTICNDITEAAFSNDSNSNETTTTRRKRALGRGALGDLEEQMLEAGRVLSSQSQARFTRPF